MQFLPCTAQDTKSDGIDARVSEISLRLSRKAPSCITPLCKSPFTLVVTSWPNQRNPLVAIDVSSGKANAPLCHCNLTARRKILPLRLCTSHSLIKSCLCVEPFPLPEEMPLWQEARESKHFLRTCQQHLLLLAMIHLLRFYQKHPEGLLTMGDKQKDKENQAISSDSSSEFLSRVWLRELISVRWEMSATKSINIGWLLILLCSLSFVPCDWMMQSYIESIC